MIRRPPRSTLSSSSAASDVYKRQLEEGAEEEEIPSESEEDQFEENDKDQEEFTLDDYIEEDEIPEYRLQANNYSKDEEKKSEIPFSVGSSFHEHLESQLGLRDLTEKQKILGEYILGNIDEDGYLRRELINICLLYTSPSPRDR